MYDKYVSNYLITALNIKYSFILFILQYKLFIHIFSINLKLDVIEKEVGKLQLLSIEQAELDTIQANKSGIENKLKIL